MVSIEVNDTRLLGDLARCLEPAEVCNPQGKLLGLFVPANLERVKEKYAQLQAIIDWKEIAQRGTDPKKCVPNNDLLDRLEELSKEETRRKNAGERGFTTEEARVFMRAAFPSLNDPALATRPAREADT